MRQGACKGLRRLADRLVGATSSRDDGGEGLGLTGGHGEQHGHVVGVLVGHVEQRAQRGLHLQERRRARKAEGEERWREEAVGRGWQAAATLASGWSSAQGGRCSWHSQAWAGAYALLAAEPWPHGKPQAPCKHCASAHLGGVTGGDAGVALEHHEPLARRVLLPDLRKEREEKNKRVRRLARCRVTLPRKKGGRVCKARCQRWPQQLQRPRHAWGHAAAQAASAAHVKQPRPPRKPGEGPRSPPPRWRLQTQAGEWLRPPTLAPKP